MDGDDLDATTTHKKFLVGHSGQQATSIFDYVHLSAKALRNVRHGQPLDHAIYDKPVFSQRPRHSNHTTRYNASPEDLINMKEDFFAHPCIKRDISTGPLPSASRTFPDSPNKIASLLRYGRTVRFVADDGCILLVDSDGSLKKGAASLASDRRSQLTIFEKDPLGVGPISKCVRAGKDIFLAQGVASIFDEHNVVHANSQAMRDAKTEIYNQSQRDCGRPKVWRLTKAVNVVEGKRLGHDGKDKLQSIDRDYFQQDSVVEIRQGELVVCYEPLELKTQREIPSSESHSTSPSAKSTALYVNGGDASKANLLQDLLLDFNPPSSMSTRWRVVDVVGEQIIRHQKLSARTTTQHSYGLKKMPSPAALKTPDYFASRKTNGVPYQTMTSENPETSENDDVDLKDQLNRAARIIVRFLRRICVDEAAKKRITELARTKRRQLHRLTLGAIGGNGGDLTPDQQLRILRCYKPQVYAAQPLLVPSFNLSPQQLAARRQMFRNRQRAQLEKNLRISNEISFLRDTHVQRTFISRPSTSQF